MSDMHADHSGGYTMDDKLQGIVEQVQGDIAMGHVSDDVSTVLRERVREAGLTVSEEDLETIASDIELEANR